MKIKTFTKLSQVFSPKFSVTHSVDLFIDSRKEHAQELELLTYLRCFGVSVTAISKLQRLQSQKNCYLFYFIWWELLHILQFVNTLTMAVIVAKEITSALFQQVDDNA